MKRSWLGAVWGLVFTGLAGATLAQGTGARAYVLDQGAQSLTAVDVADGRVAQTAKIEGAPARLLRTADGRRLVVLDRGQGRDAGDAGYQAKTKSALTIVDGRSLAVQWRLELGTGLVDQPMLAQSGDRLSVVTEGFAGKSAAEQQPRELITVDLAAGTIASRVVLPRSATAFFATPDGRTVVVLSARETPRRGPTLPAELRFIDVTAGTIVATVPLEGDPGGPVLSPDGQYVYLLDRGKPNGNPDKNVNGVLHAVSMKTHTVEAVSDAGSRPRGLVLDEARRQLLLLSDGAPFKGSGNHERPGELRVIRGAQASTPIPVVGTPERIEASADGRALYVFGLFGLTRLSVPDLSPSPMIKAPRMGDPDSAVSADGRRGWVVIGDSFITHDLEKGVKIDDVRTGRAGKKLLLGLQAWSETETSKRQARQQAEAAGQSHYIYTEYTVKPARGALAVVPDGKAVYAMNSMTDDITVVDAETGKVIKKVAAGGFAAEFMPAISAALVAGPSDVHVLDTTTHEKQPSLVTDHAGGFKSMQLSPDARQAVIQGTGAIVLVNTASGKPVGQVLPFKQVVDVAIDWGAAGR